MKASPRIFLLLITLTLCTNTFSRDVRGRLGLGLTNQLVNGVPALSFKLQKSRSFAFGAVAGIELDDNNGSHGAGIKVYRNIYEEPQLHFYTSLLMALVGDTVAQEENSGFQVDLTLGSEFSFAGLQSIGFSFEFGLNFNNVYEDTVIGITGHNFVTAGIHFYL